MDDLLSGHHAISEYCLSILHSILGRESNNTLRITFLFKEAPPGLGSSGPDVSGMASWCFLVHSQVVCHGLPFQHDGAPLSQDICASILQQKSPKMFPLKIFSRNGPVLTRYEFQIDPTTAQIKFSASSQQKQEHGVFAHEWVCSLPNYVNWNFRSEFTALVEHVAQSCSFGCQVCCYL